MNDFCIMLFKEVDKKRDGLIQDFMENHGDEIIPFWEYFDSSNNTILSKTIFNEMYNDFNFLCNYLETNLKNKSQIEKFINSQNNQGFTALHYASFKGKISVISRLVKLNADISIKNAKGLTVLHLAAQGNQPNSLAYFKEKCNENLNNYDKANSTPLHWACYTGSLKVVDYLLCNDDVELDQTDDQKVTALHLAVICDNIQIIKRLLRAGANRYIKDNNGRTPGDLAILKKKKCAKIFKKKKKKCCNCIIIKTPNTKIKKSRKNIYLFLTLYIFSIITEIIFVIDNNSINLSIFLVNNIIVFILYFSLIFLNTRVNKPQINVLQLLEEGKDISEYCTKCKIKKENHTVHCFICQRCIEDFDHHCYWINKCVGKKNYWLFMFFLYYNFYNFIFYFYLDFHYFFKKKKKALNLFFSIINLGVITFFSMLILLLIVINTRNACYNRKAKKLKNLINSTCTNKLIDDA